MPAKSTSAARAERRLTTRPAPPRRASNLPRSAHRPTVTRKHSAEAKEPLPTGAGRATGSRFSPGPVLPQPWARSTRSTRRNGARRTKVRSPRAGSRLRVLAGEGVPGEGRGLRWAGLWRRCLKRAGSREKEGLRARSWTVVGGGGVRPEKGHLLRRSHRLLFGSCIHYVPPLWYQEDPKQKEGFREGIGVLSLRFGCFTFFW